MIRAVCPQVMHDAKLRRLAGHLPPRVSWFDLVETAQRVDAQRTLHPSVRQSLALESLR